MTDPRLVNYIKRGLADGINKEQINTLLIDAGWTQGPIDAGFREAGGEKHINPGSGASTFEKLRRWLLILIGARLALIPVTYFLVPLLFQSDYYSYGDYLASSLLITFILPLFWILPFVLIWRRKKAGHIIAILFSVVLIYLNVFGFIYLLGGDAFSILSAVYFITGLAIISLSIRSFKYFPGKFEQPNTLIPIDESNVIKTRLVITSIFAFVVCIASLIPTLMFDLVRRGTLSEVFFTVFAIGFIPGILFGWIFAGRLIDCIKNNRPWTSIAVSTGFFGGVIAHLPILFLGGELGTIVFAIAGVVGGVIGVIVSFLGGTLLLHVIAESLLGKK